MSVQSKPFYWLQCDTCGHEASDSDYGDFAAFADQGQAIDNALDADWTTDGEKHHCSECPVLTRCDNCQGPAGNDAGERDDLCQECWDKAEAEEAAAVAAVTS